MRSREVWAVTVSYFCYGYVAWIFFSWFYRYLAKVRGLDLKASAFYSMLPFLAMLVCCLVGGTINDRLTKWRGPRLGRCGVAAVAMAVAGIFDRLRLASSGRTPGQRCASWRRGRTLFVAEFFLVGNRRHRRRFSRVGLGLYEYGWSDWWSLDRLSHSLDRGSIRLDCIVSGGSRFGCARCDMLACR